MKLKILSFNLIVLAMLIYFFIPIDVAFAQTASVNIVAPALEGQSIQVGKEFQANIVINEDNAINAFDFVINYSKGKAQFLEVQKTNSIVDIWTNSGLNSPGQIFLSGAISKSFSGKGGLIAGLRFKTISPGNLNISFGQSNVYMADGTGAKARIETTPLSLYVVADSSAVENNGATNNITQSQTFENENSFAPAILDFQIIKNLADGATLASFKIQGESASSPPEMRIKKWFFWGNWQAVQNPAPLQSGVWAVELRVLNNNGQSGKTIYDFRVMFEKLLLLFLASVGFAALPVAVNKIYNYNKRRKVVL